MPKRRDIDYYIENIRNFGVKIPWDIFVRILTDYYGCEMENKPGSKRVFIKDAIRVTADEPHGRERFVSKLDRKRVITYLINQLE